MKRRERTIVQASYILQQKKPKKNRPHLMLACACLPRVTLRLRAPAMMAMNHTAAPTGSTLRDLPKSWHFTDSLPADSQYPTPAASHRTPRDRIRPRQVRNAAFTWVRPEEQKDPELLAVSPAALRDLGIQAGQERTEEFRQFVAGNRLYGWDEEKLQGGYPWAQCYGGFQFGQWAGQLGDGRAISLFETRNPATGRQYELQLKGAGLTPYSRFADGKAVLRSSIREFVVSEALHALGIPTTRALSLTLLPHSKVVRETVEPGAIVLRFAESWIRLGNFDILRARQDRGLIRKLATFIAEDVFGGWETLPARWQKLERADESPLPPPPPAKHGVGKNDLEGPIETAENRFTRLYREIARRNAKCVAGWQAYGFMNGVLVRSCPSTTFPITHAPFRANDSQQRTRIIPPCMASLLILARSPSWTILIHHIHQTMTIICCAIATETNPPSFGGISFAWVRP